jgi:hypothetical protein
VRLEGTELRVRFDDRLLTVLSQPAGDRHDSAVRWRQLVDLVARAGSNASSAIVADALAAIRTDAAQVDDHLRAAAARAVAALPLPVGLLEYFASDSLAVSAPVLAAASLEPEQWRAVLAAADEETRRFVHTLHPEIAAAPKAEMTDQLIEEQASPEVEAPPAPAPSPPAGPSLSEVVARIERRRRNRAAQQVTGAAPGVVPHGSANLFRWECGPNGEIAWVEGAPRGPLIGRSIARAQDQDGDRISAELARAFTMRAPFRDALLAVAGEGPVAGEWKVSGVPAFEPTDGRFAGYRGIALRDVPAAANEPDIAGPELPDPDSLRELVHEIKTPLNAIIGFAEIIDGQFLGPADRGYRERAGDIVTQARLLLGAIDDLDFAATVHSSDATAARRVDLAELFASAAGSLKELADARGAQIELPRIRQSAIAAVEPELTDRLVYRLASAIIARAETGERIRMSVDQSGARWRISITRPAALRGSAGALLSDTAGDERDRGAALQLRLVRGLARVAGGDLAMTASVFALLLPASRSA